MDRKQFDALIKLLATTGSRRAGLGALLGAGLLSQHPDVMAKPGKGKGQRRKRRQKRRRGDDNGGQAPGPSSGACCGADEHCAPPEPGSTRSQCDFAEQSFAGEDHHGSIFRRIDGVGTNFDGTDNRGSVFTEACLRFATFRGAKLGGATWTGACLFAADFTDADVGGDADALSRAVLCATTMPDGTRSDRDCGQSQAHPCCLPPPGGGGVGGGQGCGPCAAADQCHVAGTCVCTTPTAPNGTSCTDGNPLCVAGVCCTDGREAVHGGCFKIGDRHCEGCNRNACDGCYGNVDGSAVDGRNTNLCGFRTGPDCQQQ